MSGTISSKNNEANPYRNLPSVDRLLNSDKLKSLVDEEGLPRDLVTELARERLALARQSIQNGGSAIGLEELLVEIEQEAHSISQGRLREVINATGVVIHTNLGRAPLSREATKAVERVAAGYSNLEFDLETGERGHRLSHISDLIARVSGAEAAIAVNNNASAVFMVLTCFARNKEVIISRGQAVEIGGAFRVPEVISQSGAKLVDVGTTNKTYLRDYEQAVTPETAVLLRVHSSNFRVIGFTHETPLGEMAQLAKQRNLLLVDDLGSGTFIDTTRYGLSHEPMVQESLSGGADLVTFSGDKLLGGPQAGLIAGRKNLIEKLKKHPLARALRLDKMTLAALQTTLLHYLRNEAEQKIPVWHMIAMPLSIIEQRAENWRQALASVWPGATTQPGLSTIGGGSLPGETLPTHLLALPAPPDRGAAAFTAALRGMSPALVCRVEREMLLLDPRTVLAVQEETMLALLKQVISG